MEGLNQGLENGKKDLQKTLNGIANTISGTEFGTTAGLGYAGAGAAAGMMTNTSTAYNIYINGAKINDDSQIESKFKALLTEMARKGMM